MKKIILMIISTIICYGNIFSSPCTLTTDCENKQFDYKFCKPGEGFVHKCSSNPYSEDGLTPLKLSNSCINYYPDTYQIQYKAVYSYKTVYDTTYNDVYDWEQIGTDPDTGDPIYDSVYVRTDTISTPRTVCTDTSQVS